MTTRNCWVPIGTRRQAHVYLHAWNLTSFRSQAVTGNQFFRAIAEEILDYVIRDMLEPAGVFYSTQDADSEGVEGKFFVWTPSETQEVSGGDADELMTAYCATRHGSYEGKNILVFVGDLGQWPALAGARCKLYQARAKRIHPGRDEMVLAT